VNYSTLSRPVITACVMQFDIAFGVNFASGFLTLFINSDLGVTNLAEAALWAGILQFATAGTIAVGQPVWGMFFDRVGGTKMLMRILIAYTCTMAIVAVSTNIYQVLLANLLQGIFGGTSTVIMAIIASTVEEEHLTQALGYQQAAQTAGFLLGPALGGIVAVVLGFRACYLFGAIMMASSLPLLRWARFPKIQASAETREKVDWRSLKALWRDFLALVSIQTAYEYLAPILPLYLVEAGLVGNSVVSYTAIVLSLSSLAYGVSVPITSRRIGRRHFSFMATVASAIILLQGFFRNTTGFICLRMAQCAIQSGGPALLVGSVGGRKKNKGLSIGILNSGRLIGDALAPLIASSVAFADNLTTSFTVIASISFLGAILATYDDLKRRRLRLK
jgi:DHA1 family multidrug resistance protein-like MFS transporter